MPPLAGIAYEGPIRFHSLITLSHIGTCLFSKLAPVHPACLDIDQAFDVAIGLSGKQG